MSELKVSVSGIRGIWGDTLTLNTLYRYIVAFGKYIQSKGGNRILIGRDARPTGFLISNYASSILNAMGIDICDIGLAPTPTILFGVRNFNFDGGLIITASHNPIEWNALKFVKKGGYFTTEKDLNEILSLLDTDFKEMPYNKIGKCDYNESILYNHADTVLLHIDTDLIKKRNYKVVIDPVNSAGSVITPYLLEKMGCEVIPVFANVNGYFERPTEPNPENLTHLKEIIIKNNAHIGFAQDPDADRLVVIDEKGNVLSEELTFALSLLNVLEKKKGNIVINLSTSRVNIDIANRFGCNVYKSKVGEANVVEMIHNQNAIIGGEGNGGVIYPEINTARDSLVGIALILELIAKQNKPLSEIVNTLPKYTMRKKKYDFKGNITKLYENLKKEFKDYEINDLDGVRFDKDDKWIHIRPSNTEPVIRIIGEARDIKDLNEIFDKAEGVLNSL